MLADLLKKLLYGSRALGLYHRIRNADTLTVIMFHRVLDPADPRWAGCDPDYTLSAQHFEECLRFFARHYNIVSADAVLLAGRGAARLPRRALLLTFDDGWADNVQYALPAMRRLGMPGLIFVVSDAVDRAEPFFQERIVGAWRRGRLTLERLAEALHALDVGPRSSTAPPPLELRALIRQVEALPGASRQRLLATLESELADDCRHMVSTAELAQLEAGGMRVGLHGKSHVPLTLADDLDAQLAGARRAVAQRLPRREAPVTMSFPHGKFDAAIAAQARQAGFEVLFTSVPVLNPARGALGALLGRVGFESRTVADAQGRFRPEWLALHLFRRPQRNLG